MSLSRFLLCVQILAVGVAAAGCKAVEASIDELTAAAEQDIPADASFMSSTSSDCVTAFATKPFLGRVASRRGWTATDIQSFCDNLATIQKSYVNDTTFTTVTVAGVGTLKGTTATSAYYMGATGYDLTAIRQFLQTVAGDGAIRHCIRMAFAQRLLTGSIPQGFVVSCLESETGKPFPKALFRLRLSNTKLGDLGNIGAGGGINIAMIKAPGGVAVGLLGGAFYAEASPPYGAFLGCGAVAGVVPGAAAASPICLGAEFVDVNEGVPPGP